MSLSDIDLLRHIYDEVDFVLRATKGKTQEQVINNEVLIRAINIKHLKYSAKNSPFEGGQGGCRSIANPQTHVNKPV